MTGVSNLEEADITPRVSVVMAVYNGRDYLRLAIESVVSQSFESLEFIIVDDCSTDDTPQIIRSFGDLRIVYTRNAENIGQTASLNVGLGRARGELIARIDADDVWHPEKLEKQCQFMADHPEVTVCGTWADRIGRSGEVIGTFLPPTDLLEIRYRILWASPVCHVSVVMRRAAILECGGYLPQYRFAADYALWSQLLREGHAIVNLPLKLTQFREMPETFGTAYKVGPAGDESAEIIQFNAAAIANLSLDHQQCRNIALMLFPAADLSGEAVCEASVNLGLLAEDAYGSPPLRIRLELLGMLFWSLFKRAALARKKSGFGSYREESLEVLRAFRGRPAALIVAGGALMLAVVGLGSGMKMKAWVTACVFRVRTLSRRT